MASSLTLSQLDKDCRSGPGFSPTSSSPFSISLTPATVLSFLPPSRAACSLPGPCASRSWARCLWHGWTGRGSCDSCFREPSRFGAPEPLVSSLFQPSSRLVLSNTANPNVAIRAPESSCWAYREASWAFRGDLFLKIVVDLLWQQICPVEMPAFRLSQGWAFNQHKLTRLQDSKRKLPLMTHIVFLSPT